MGKEIFGGLGGDPTTITTASSSSTTAEIGCKVTMGPCAKINILRIRRHLFT